MKGQPETGLKKEHRYSAHGKYSILRPALSTLGYQLVTLLLCNFVCISFAGFMGSASGLAAIESILLLIYFGIVYSSLWNQGREDKNLANFGHIVLDRWRGIKIGLLANLPFLVMGGLLILSRFGLFWNFVFLYKIVNAQFWPLINLFRSTLDVMDFAVWQVVVIALLPLLTAAVSQLGYLLGIKDVSILQKLIYRDKKDKNTGKTGLN